MSLIIPGQLPAAPPVRRVRDVVREGVAVILFSAVASSGLAAAFLFFLQLVD